MHSDSCWELSCKCTEKEVMLVQSQLWITVSSTAQNSRTWICLNHWLTVMYRTEEKGSSSFGNSQEHILRGVLFTTKLINCVCHHSAKSFSERAEPGILHLPSGWCSLTWTCFHPQPTPYLRRTIILYRSFGDTDLSSADLDPRGVRGVKLRVKCRTQTLSSLCLLDQKNPLLNTYLVDLRRQEGTKALPVRSRILNSTLKTEARYGVMCMQKNTQLSKELPYPALTSTDFRLI